VLLLFFTDCPIHLFSSLAARLFNKLTRYSLLVLFPVSFTIEYKVGIAEFYLYMGCGADRLKDVLTRACERPKSESAHL